MPRLLQFSFLMWLFCAPPSHSAEHIWVEGEAATSRKVVYNSWYNHANPDLVSGGGWLTHFGDKPGTASYEFESKNGGQHLLWLRFNPKNSKLHFRVNQGEWHKVIEQHTYDRINVAADGKHDSRFVAWAHCGHHHLKKGKNQLDVKFISEYKNHGAVDCFCLTTTSEYIPEKKRKPGETRPYYTTPTISEENFNGLMSFVEPSEQELAWQKKVRWHTSLSEASIEARKLNRPILLWAMNGHPSGET